MKKYINHNSYLNLKNDHNYKLLFKYNVYKNNKDFIKESIKDDYIVNNVFLDNYQKEACFIDEVNTLVIAGAGSGKTLTIIGKIKYLIEEKNIDPKEILCISFTNDTVNNLKSKLNYEVDVFTFHKLALEIINDYKVYYKPCSSDYLEYIINEIFYSICPNIDKNIIDSFNNKIASFINLFKVNNYDISFMNNLIKKNKDNKLLQLIKKIYYIYEEELNSTGEIDFNDMINLSIKLIREKGLKRYYKYVIIDEFQDISNTRKELIKEIINSSNSFLFAVGDDYQSIYRFAGSNIKLITNFKKYFGYTKIIKLKYTYRNSNELIRVASDFVLKNKNQIRKELISNKSLYKPIKIIYYKKNMNIMFHRLVKKIDNNFLVLVRNNYDINLLDSDDIKDIKYMTIHKSKGLEEENIIIINLTNDYYGFPSKRRNYLNDLLIKKEEKMYEEERRLFYVALTRSKNYVYLLVDKENPSIFVKEIVKLNKKHIEVLDL